MNTQNTPIHIKLWHKDFWLMSIAGLMLSLSVYMLLPTLPLWMLDKGRFSPMETGLAMGVFGIGVFSLGCFCSYWVQCFRRNMVCICAVVALMLIIAGLHYVNGFCCPVSTPPRFTHSGLFALILLERFLMGAVFGLAQMVLMSTLVIDTCESFQRTEANHCATWFSRFTVSLGPLLGLLLYQLRGLDAVLVSSLVSLLAVIVFVRWVHFPFRAPDDGMHVLSLDRFLLPQGFPLSVNLTLMMAVVGLLLTVSPTPYFFAMLMVGFWMALLAQRFVFREAELESEVITGILLLTASILMQLTSSLPIVSYLSPIFIGIATGLIGSRFLLFFIKLSNHCQRGTAQSTYLLATELGISLGLFLAYSTTSYLNALFSFSLPVKDLSLYLALTLTVLSFVLYHFFTHRWFMSHKNR